MNANLMEPEGKTVLAAGPTSGTGKATASALARLDAAVIVTGRNAEPAAERAERTARLTVVMMARTELGRLRGIQPEAQF
jgi:NAD(P)-dependent dehydrogenase (short-subunit alcohol dehydrogenase family)